ncbi:zinc finger protein 184-like [Thrips palmi]|uniref:Zinc finger protein 184-like n=1 Tax=Thrips palmi TaxID=161013 RepID=A0A6P8YY14_THRPL|nr:zinc finger protein 184-like [Thrips palmi]XP_034242157.1 zinc finger protein 184-like [Thrips palmi]
MNDRLSPHSDQNDDASSSSPTIAIPNLSFGIGPYGLPQGKALLGSSPSAVAMLYPQISAYEIHPLIINQRRRSSLDKSGLDSDLTGSSDDSGPLGLVSSHSLGSSPTPLPLSLRHLYREISVAQKQRNVRRRAQVRDPVELNPDDSDDLYSGSDIAGNSQPDSEASDYSSKTRKSFFCRACGKSFKFQTSLLRHNNKVHISKYQCSTCKRVFSRQAYLDVHTSKPGSTCYISPYTLPSPGRAQNSSLPLSMGII